MSTILDKASQILSEKNANLIAENIKKDVQIFDVTGTYEGTDTSDADATVDDIALNKTAYVNGSKITGTLNIAGSSNYSPSMFENIQLTTYGGNDVLQFTTSRGGNALHNIIIQGGSTITGNILQSTIASLAGLTADKIKSGETILGITGTYTGE